MARNIALQVSEQDIDRFTRVATVRINEKLVATPCYATLIQTPNELDLFLRLKEKYSPMRLGAFVVRYFDAPAILNKIQPSVKMDMLGRVREDKYSILLRSNLFMIDPVTEYLYYDARTDAFSTNSETPHEIIDFASKLKKERKYNDPKVSFSKRRDRLHREFWKGIVEDTQKKIKFVKSFLEYQMICGVDVILPPAPLIYSKEMLEIAVAINDTAKEISRGRRLCATYLPVKNTVLKSDTLMDDIKMAVYENASKTLTVFKFKNLNLSSPPLITERENYRQLMIDLATFSQTFKDRACMVLENSYQAFASPFAGFDLVSTSFTFYDFDISFSEHPPYGSYLDPTWKVHRKFDDIADCYRNLGRLPCPCKVCKEVTLPDLRLMPSEQWNNIRRMHVPMLMDNWMEYVARAVRERNTELTRDNFANSKISNLKDLLP